MTRTCRTAAPPVLATAALLAILAAPTLVLAQGRAGGAPAAPPTPKAAAPIDPTGYWVAIISEDWRWRMVTPAKGDYASIPLTVEGKRIADQWDPAKDEKAGEACKAYGAPGLMRAPTRLHITWADDTTLQLESDYGQQVRKIQFKAPAGPPAPPSWQGVTTAQWVMATGGGRGAPATGSLKSVTTRLKPGYLRKNGVPYSGNAVFTEYWDVHKEANGDQYLVVTNVVDDPANLQLPWITAIHFKKEADGAKWDPTPCNARW